MSQPVRIGRPPKPPTERFWPKVRHLETCWEWTGALDVDGYGRFRDGAGRIVFAHRWAYQAVVGEIPEGLTLDHLCGNKRCVNPDHLEPVSAAVNVQRSHAFRRHCCGGTCASYPPRIA